MARAGINKTRGSTARVALLARGSKVTIDAIRFELRNTGSKSTIQRYLKRLTEQPGGNGSDMSRKAISRR